MAVHENKISKSQFTKLVNTILPDLMDQRESNDRVTHRGDKITLRPYLGYPMNESSGEYGEYDVTMSTVNFYDDDVHEGLGTTTAYILNLSTAQCLDLIRLFFRNTYNPPEKDTFFYV